CILFFFNHASPILSYPLSLHDALPIFLAGRAARQRRAGERRAGTAGRNTSRHVRLRRASCALTLSRRAGRTRAAVADGSAVARGDRKSTRLNSSHVKISYAVFCLKKKK